MGGCLNECQEFGKDRGIVLTLDVFARLQVDSGNQDGAFSGLPWKGLIPTALDGEGLERCKAARLIPKDQGERVLTKWLASPWMLRLRFFHKGCRPGN